MLENFARVSWRGTSSMRWTWRCQRMTRVMMIRITLLERIAMQQEALLASRAPIATR